jgi:hypothetical protein
VVVAGWRRRRRGVRRRIFVFLFLALEGGDVMFCGCNACHDAVGVERERGWGLKGVARVR